ncbi:MAG: tetratricopeptide repeat protein [Bdellovibrionales bacterium]|nr:tetratricopeptide repeat protein [Bdellovibrionales bacterium]
MENKSFSPLIYDYLKKYQEDPTSRIFAPLAEAYRKAGLLDEAIEIAREGLRVHPNFVGGRVALARALFEKRQYDEVVEGLAVVVREVPDNLVAQKLLAESCLMLGRIAEALSAFKMLLYFNPSDTETARVVAELEAQAYEDGVLVLRKDPAPQKMQIKPARDAISRDDRVLRAQAIAKIELLQTALVRIERYRHQNHS